MKNKAFIASIALMTTLGVSACGNNDTAKTDADSNVAEADNAADAAEAGHIAFTQEAFEAAQAENKSILIDVYAPWCSTCKKQQPILSQLQKEEANKDLVVFRVDFDNQKDTVRQFEATKQSTLIAFKGTKETSRAVGITSAEEISELIASAS